MLFGTRSTTGSIETNSETSINVARVGGAISYVLPSISMLATFLSSTALATWLSIVVFSILRIYYSWLRRQESNLRSLRYERNEIPLLHAVISGFPCPPDKVDVFPSAKNSTHEKKSVIPKSIFYLWIGYAQSSAFTLNFL